MVAAILSPAAGHVLGRLTGGDVFEYHAQAGQALEQRLEHGIDEYGFAVEHVDGRVGHFTVYQQRHANFRHCLQRGHGVVHVTHAGVRVGGSTGRVQLDAVDEAAGFGLAHFVGSSGFGQVQRHQRFKRAASRARRQDALAVGCGQLDGSDRRFQVGHDDGAAHLTAGIGQHGSQGRAVAYVQVPVVGAGNGEGH